MTQDKRIEISLASNTDREQIYRLRYLVYSVELMQHAENESKILKDKLDDFNTYLIAKIDHKIVGFISITPPDNNSYSIDKYFMRTDLPFDINDGLYEMRILTVMAAHRGKPIALALMWAAFRWIQSNGGKSIMAIGRKEILKLYTKLGFNAMGNLVKSGKVMFELLHGEVNKLSTFIEDHYKPLFLKLQKQCVWNINISFFKPTSCYHGGSFFEAIGNEFDRLDKREEIINADVLDAWFDPSPKITQKLNNHLPWICKTSPPTDCSGMTKSIAELRAVKPENILPGAGSSDLIFLAFREWLSPMSRVLILDPSYGEYAHVLEHIIGCNVDRIHLTKENEYGLDTRTLIAKSKNNYDLIVIVNPNSPTGQHIDKQILKDVLTQIPVNTRVWIDETYIEYTGKNQSLERYAAKSNNVIICKSMSKVYALSGLRSAYLCASASQLERLKSLSPPWSVSLPAQIAAITAMQDFRYYEKCYKTTHLLRNEFAKELRQIDSVEITQTNVNFILCHLPKNGPTAETIVTRCKDFGLYIRDISNMGTHIGKHTLRIAVKDKKTNHKMLKILKQVL